MDFLMSISLAKPGGFWSDIIFGMDSVVGSYALAVILITIIIRLVLTPLDFLNKNVAKKTSRKQLEMKPELDKINKAYANNKDLLNQKTMQVYKKHNFNVGGSCIVMLAYMIITMVVFFSLFGTLNDVASYKIAEEYVTVRDSYYATYETAYNTHNGLYNPTDEEYKDNVIQWVNGYLFKSQSEVEALSSDDKHIYDILSNVRATADTNANIAYDKAKTSFLWIKSIWCNDAMWSSPTLSYKDFTNNSQIKADRVTESEYNLVMGAVRHEHSGMNGFFILAILSAASQFASLKLNAYLSRRKAEKQGIPVAEDPTSNKTMSIIMPALMGIFPLFYNAAFGIYLVASGLVSIVTSTISTLIVDNIDAISFKKNKEKNRASYSRKK